MMRIAHLGSAGVLAFSTMFAPIASADNDESLGSLCSFVAMNDTSGVLSTDPVEVAGFMRGGPLVAGDFLDDSSPGPSHTTVDEGTLHCWVQYNSVAAHFPWATAHCDFVGVGVIEGSCQILYYSDNGGKIFLCAMLETHGSTYVYDDDASLSGDQCAPASEIVDRGRRVNVGSIARA